MLFSKTGLFISLFIQACYFLEKCNYFNHFVFPYTCSTSRKTCEGKSYQGNVLMWIYLRKHPWMYDKLQVFEELFFVPLSFISQIIARNTHHQILLAAFFLSHALFSLFSTFLCVIKRYCDKKINWNIDWNFLEPRSALVLLWYDSM